MGGLTFATDDAGKTFTYKVAENKGDKGGYTYDSTYWTVEIAVKKRDNGSLYTVTTVKHFDADKKELSADEKNSENGLSRLGVLHQQLCRVRNIRGPSRPKGDGLRRQDRGGSVYV